MENKYKIKKKAVNQNEIKHKKRNKIMFGQQLEIEMKTTKNDQPGDGAVLKVEFQKAKWKRNQKQENVTNMVANLGVNNLKSEWEQQTDRDRYV